MDTTLRPARIRWYRWALGAAAAGFLALPGSAGVLRGPAPTAVEVLRTADGIPHIRAVTWRGLGLGYGYAQAEDALCTLAEEFVTLSARRSYHFGPDGRPQTASTFGKSTNLELDFFFQAFAGATAVEDFKRQQPSQLLELIAGYAEGYNRYVRDLSRKPARAVPHACREEPWLQAIQPEDIYRRMIAAGLAGGYARFIPEIVNAQPAAAALATPAEAPSLQSRLAIPVGDMAGIGSNMLAFGARATGQREGVLFGNPHWYWGGPDRFYQAHLTLRGKMDVAGVSFLGIPVIMIGFNDHVAWSHTVSAARRFGLFELLLDPSDPTRYSVDGVFESMQAVPLAVAVRRPDGAIEIARRTLYRTRFGPVVDLGRRNAAFGWGAQRALAMRDVNEGNLRVFRNYFRWNQAKALDEFIEIQQQEAAMPWVNTSAIGRGDGRVWYADVGAVPNVPDELRAACSASLSKAFAALDSRTPLLDGSRSACQWRIDPLAVQPGAMPSGQLPSLLREDYVANMNDSYWLTNPAQPLTGYPAVLGGERNPLTLRGREGHRIAAELASAGASSAGALARRLMRRSLQARSYSADQFKQILLAHVCQGDQMDVASTIADPSASAMEVRQACQVLRDWSNRAEARDRGALLWDAFWARLQKIPPSDFYAIAFSPAAPLQTPREPNASDPRVLHALIEAARDLAAKGWALDTPLGHQRFVRSEGRRLPLFGGCDAAGYFAIACNTGGEYAMGKSSLGNSYLQVVYFGPRGVEAHTLLAHGQRETAVENGPGAAPVLRYVRKDWLRFPFREEDIARDPALTRLLLRP